MMDRKGEQKMMKKRKEIIFVILVMVTVVLAGCGSENKISGNSGSGNKISGNYGSGNKISGNCGDDIKWELDQETKTLYLKGKGATWDFMTAEEYHERMGDAGKDYEETGYSERPEWITYAEEIENIVIKDGITELGAGVFADLPNLKNVDFGNTVEGISGNAFKNTGLEEITLPENVSWIAYCSFVNNHNLKKVILEGGNELLGNEIFRGCENLEEVFFMAKDYELEEDTAEEYWFFEESPQEICNENVVFYVYENTFFHEIAEFHAEKYGIRYEFIQ